MGSFYKRIQSPPYYSYLYKVSRRTTNPPSISIIYYLKISLVILLSLLYLTLFKEFISFSPVLSFSFCLLHTMGFSTIFIWSLKLFTFVYLIYEENFLTFTNLTYCCYFRSVVDRGTHDREEVGRQTETQGETWDEWTRGNRKLKINPNRLSSNTVFQCPTLLCLRFYN